jgi:hypothetical protein
VVYVGGGTFCKTSVPRSDELFALFGLFAGITGCMQNSILNNMQPKVQSDYEREPEHSGSFPKFRSARLTGAFGFGGSDRPQLRCGAKPRSCPIATGAFTENVFGADARPPIKMALFMFARGEKSHLTQSTSMSAAGCACVA